MKIALALVAACVSVTLALSWVMQLFATVAASQGR